MGHNKATTSFNPLFIEISYAIDREKVEVTAFQSSFHRAWEFLPEDVDDKEIFQSSFHRVKKNL